MGGYKRSSSGSGSGRAYKYAKKSTSRPSVRTLVMRELNKRLEYKQSVTSASLTSSTTTGTVVPLNNNIAQGDGGTARTGNQINTLYIDIQYSYRSSATSMGAQVALVYDAQPNASAPAYSSIFDANGGAAGFAYLDTLNNKERFKVIWMDTLPTSGQAADPITYLERRRHYVNVQKACMKSKYHKEMCNTRYGGTGAAVPTVGAFYLCFGDASNAGAFSQISYIAKYCFSDL